MFRNVLTAAFALVTTAALTGNVFAQEFPGIGVGDMWANEMAFQNQFYQWAWAGSQEVARQIPDDQPLPFDAMTISRSTSEGMRAFEGYTGAWHVSQDRTMAAIEGYDVGAIRGEATYVNPYDGSGYVLPYGPEAYHRDAPGYMYEGENPYSYGDNYYVE